MRIKPCKHATKKTSVCTECKKDRKSRLYYKKNKKKLKPTRAAWRRKNKKKIRSKRSKYWFNVEKKQDPSARSRRGKKWWKNLPRTKKNKIVKKSMAKNRSPKARARNRQARLDLKLSVIKRYGGRCKCCRIIGADFMTVDHIDGGGTKHRKKNKTFRTNPWKWLKKHNYPKGFQILCWNCNWSKHFGRGVCLHKRRRTQHATRIAYKKTARVSVLPFGKVRTKVLLVR